MKWRIRQRTNLLLFRSIVNATLNDTAAVLVGRGRNTVTPNGVINELIVGGAEMGQTTLNHVIAIAVLHQRQDVIFQGGDECSDLRDTQPARRQT